MLVMLASSHFHCDWARPILVATTPASRTSSPYFKHEYFWRRTLYNTRTGDWRDCQRDLARNDLRSLIYLPESNASLTKVTIERTDPPST